MYMFESTFYVLFLCFIMPINCADLEGVLAWLAVNITGEVRAAAQQQQQQQDAAPGLVIGGAAYAGVAMLLQALFLAAVVCLFRRARRTRQTEPKAVEGLESAV